MSDRCLDSVAATETERVHDKHTCMLLHHCTQYESDMALTKKLKVLRQRGRNMKFDEHPMLI
jgi:hypothetical protein